MKIIRAMGANGEPSNFHKAPYDFTYENHKAAFCLMIFIMKILMKISAYDFPYERNLMKILSL